jgi:hypothetical protein
VHSSAPRSQCCATSHPPPSLRSERLRGSSQAHHNSATCGAGGHSRRQAAHAGAVADYYPHLATSLGSLRPSLSFCRLADLLKPVVWSASLLATFLEGFRRDEKPTTRQFVAALPDTVTGPRFSRSNKFRVLQRCALDLLLLPPNRYCVAMVYVSLTQRLHSSDIAFKPAESGWGYTERYDQRRSCSAPTDAACIRLCSGMRTTGTRFSECCSSHVCAFPTVHKGVRGARCFVVVVGTLVDVWINAAVPERQHILTVLAKKG